VPRSAMTPINPTAQPRRWRSSPAAFRLAQRTPVSRRAGRLLAGSALALAILASAPSAAGADTGATIIEKCTHGQPLSGYTEQDYRQALHELPTEVEEYSDCANLIRHAELGAAGGGSESAGAGAVATPLTPAEHAAIKHAATSAAAPVQIGGQTVRPGVVHVNIASALNSLPSSLLATLAFLIACLVIIVGGAIRERVRARKRS
jgi:hypothetical protein